MTRLNLMKSFGNWTLFEEYLVLWDFLWFFLWFFDVFWFLFQWTILGCRGWSWSFLVTRKPLLALYLQSLDVFWYLLQPKGDSIKWLNLDKFCGKKVLNNFFFSRTVVCFAFIRWCLDDEIEPDEIIWQLNIIRGISCAVRAFLWFFLWFFDVFWFLSQWTILGCRGWSWSFLVTRKRLLALFFGLSFFSDFDQIMLRWRDWTWWNHLATELVSNFFFAFVTSPSSWIYLQSLDVFWYLLQPKGDSIKWLNLNKFCGKKVLNNFFFSRTVVCFAFIRWCLDDEIEPDEIIWQLNIIRGISCALSVSLVLPLIFWCVLVSFPMNDTRMSRLKLIISCDKKALTGPFFRSLVFFGRRSDNAQMTRLNLMKSFGNWTFLKFFFAFGTSPSSWIYLQSLDVFWYLLQPKGDSIKWLNEFCGKEALNNIFSLRLLFFFCFYQVMFRRRDWTWWNHLATEHYLRNFLWSEGFLGSSFYCLMSCFLFHSNDARMSRLKLINSCDKKALTGPFFGLVFFGRRSDNA